MVFGECLVVKQPEPYVNGITDSDGEDSIIVESDSSDDQDNDYEEVIVQTAINEPDNIPENIEEPNNLGLRSDIPVENDNFTYSFDEDYQSLDVQYGEEFGKQIEILLRELRMAPKIDENVFLSELPQIDKTFLIGDMSPCKSIKIFNYRIMVDDETLKSPRGRKEFQKTFWLLLRYSEYLTFRAVTHLLTVLANFRHFDCITKRHSGVIRFFLSRVIPFANLQIVLSGKPFNEIIYLLLHKFFGDLACEGHIIEDKLSMKLVTTSYSLLKSLKLTEPSVQAVLELLALFAANCNKTAEVLLRNEIEQTLDRVEKKFYASKGMLKLPFLKLIFALIPASKDTNNYLRDEIERESYYDKMWGQFCSDGWKPFPLKINHAIYRALYEKKKEIRVAESRVIKTIDVKNMIIVNEASSKCRKISYLIPYYSWIDIKKEKSPNAFMSNKFLVCAVGFMEETLRNQHVSLEKLYCANILNSLLQYAKQFAGTGLTEKEMPHRILDLEKNCNPLCLTETQRFQDTMRSGIISDENATIPKSKKEKNNLSILTTPGGDCYCPNSEKNDDFCKQMTQDGCPTFIKLKKLEYYKNITKPSSEKQVVNEAVKYLLEFFNYQQTSEENLQNVRLFLKVFANIPLQPNPKPFEIKTGPFEDLVSTVGKILRCSEPPLAHNERYQYGLNTIRKLAHKFIGISFQLPFSIFYMRVHPFTTVQFLEGHVFVIRTNPGGQLNAYTDDCNLRNNTKFTLNGHLLPSEITVYEAIYRYGSRSTDGQGLFENTYTFICMELQPPDLTLDVCPAKSAVLEKYLRRREMKPESLTEIGEEMTKAMHLTDILFGINMHWSTAYSQIRKRPPLIDPGKFVQTELDKMLQNHLMDPFGALIGKLDPWKWMVNNCPFIFSLETRKFAFRVLSLTRRIALKTVLDKYNESSVELYNRTPVNEIDREYPYEEVEWLLVTTLPYSSWNIKFLDEDGEGRGVLCEFFTLLGREMQLSERDIWSSKDATSSGLIMSNEGLYPGTRIPADVECYKVLDDEKIFFILGQLLGKALLQNVLIDLPLAPIVFNWLVNKQSLLDIEDVKYVNPAVHKVLIFLKNMADKIAEIQNNDNLEAHKKTELIDNLEIDGCNIESYDLDFVLPGHENIELIPDGAKTQVTRFNVHKYLEEVKKVFLHTGVSTKINLLKKGFKYIINSSDIEMFQPEELMEMVCGSQDERDYWSLDNLKRHVEFKDCSIQDQLVIDMLEIMSTADAEKRKSFLQFVTACPTLPSGGFGNLEPHFAIYICPNISYPFARTCLNILHIPSNFDRNQLEAFFELAVTEGLNYFGFR